MSKVYMILAECFNKHDEEWEADNSIFFDKKDHRPVLSKIYKTEKGAKERAHNEAEKFRKEYDGNDGVLDYCWDFINCIFTIFDEDKEPWVRFRIIDVDK